MHRYTNGTVQLLASNPCFGWVQTLHLIVDIDDNVWYFCPRYIGRIFGPGNFTVVAGRGGGWSDGVGTNAAMTVYDGGLPALAVVDRNIVFFEYEPNSHPLFRRINIDTYRVSTMWAPCNAWWGTNRCEGSFTESTCAAYLSSCSQFPSSFGRYRGFAAFKRSLFVVDWGTIYRFWPNGTRTTLADPRGDYLIRQSDNGMTCVCPRTLPLTLPAVLLCPLKSCCLGAQHNILRNFPFAHSLRRFDPMGNQCAVEQHPTKRLLCLPFPSSATAVVAPLR